jgi:hypothetical protein
MCYGVDVDLNWVDSGDQGLSFQKIFKHSEAAKAFEKIALQLIENREG